jgi:low affinity Fe/Cu permease
MAKAIRRDLFQQFATSTSDLVGSPVLFTLAVFVVAVWAFSGHYFGYSDTWQLWINTGTTIVTFLMVFLIQHTQNRDARALHLKIDELLRAVHGARVEMADLHELSDEELRHLERAFSRLAKFAATRSALRHSERQPPP